MNDMQREVLGIDILNGEEVMLVLGSKEGPMKEIPAQDDYLVLTDQRVIGIWKEDVRRRRMVLKCSSVESAEVVEFARDSKPLLTGSLFIIAGLLVPWAAILLGLNGILSWLLGVVLILLGAVTASAYFVKEYAAVVTLRGGNSEIAMPLRSSRAILGAYALMNRLFSSATDHASHKAYSREPLYGEPVRWSREEDEVDRQGVSPTRELSSSGESPQLQGWHDV